MTRGTALAICSIPSSVIGIWLIAWLWHIGPENTREPVWWALPYWLSSIVAGFIIGVIVCGVLYGILDYYVRIQIKRSKE